MGIQNQIREEGQQAKNRMRFVRYGAVAAAVLLVLAGVLGVLLTGGSGKTSLSAADSSAAATITDAAEVDEAPETAMLAAIADAVEETAPAAESAAATMSSEDADEAVTTPDSYDALYALMDKITSQSRKSSAIFTSGGTTDTATATTENAAAEPASAADMGGAGSGADYSATNVQVAGVDEADIVKTDGKFIYYVANDRLIILEANGKDTKVVSQTPLTGGDAWWGYASEMFIAGDRLLLITQGMSVVRVQAQDGGYDDNRDETQVRVYDIADRAKPTLLSTMAQSGGYVSSRMADNTIYLVTTHYVWNPVRSQPITFVPAAGVDGALTTLPTTDIYVYGRPQNMAYTVIGAIDIDNERAFAGVRAVFGGTGSLYCNGKHLLLACPEYAEHTSQIAPDESGRNVQVTTSRSHTKLLLFSLDGGNITMQADGDVPGTLVNQFAMDEYEGAFRIVTSTNEWTQRIYTDGVDTYEYEDSNQNGLYTFDGDLEPLGQITDLAPDEWVKSVRFDGDIAYFVTFRQVDPLFTVDVSNPKAPKLLSSLKIPGLSEYLHVYGAGRLFGLGYAADEKTGALMGVKLSMFDTSNQKDVTERTTARIDADWTVAGGNHKAILVDTDKKLIAFPADSAYYIYTYDDATGFTELAKIAMTEDLYSWNLRGLFIGEFFYVLSDGAATVVSMADWKPVGKVAF